MFRRIVKALIPRGLFRQIEPFGHLCEAIFFNLLYGFPCRGLKVIGITGTNGKTTTAFLTHKMLEGAGYKTGLMTTVAWGTGENMRPQDIHMTNVPVPIMLKRVKAMRTEGIDWLVMEVTSHALAQNRVWGMPFYLAAMTNISQDHLDYHGTMDNYISAKVRLFRLAERNKKGMRTGIINADDKTEPRFAAVIKNSLTYGINKGQIKAKNLTLSDSGSSYKAVVAEAEYDIRCRLPGKFNIYNSLAAVGIGRALNLSKTDIEQGIASLRGVLGRMTAVEAGQSFNVFVDFAHTPDALENVLKAAKELTKGKVILVFGATGDRDKTKRPIMGESAVKNADLIYLTDDETYTEDPAQIISAVFEGIERAGGEARTKVVKDRLEAIKLAFAAARDGDTVLLSGIGHETTRNMGGKEVPWNEIEIAKNLLNK